MMMMINRTSMILVILAYCYSTCLLQGMVLAKGVFVYHSLGFITRSKKTKYNNNNNNRIDQIKKSTPTQTKPRYFDEFTKNSFKRTTKSFKQVQLYNNMGQNDNGEHSNSNTNNNVHDFVMMNDDNDPNSKSSILSNSSTRISSTRNSNNKNSNNSMTQIVIRWILQNLKDSKLIQEKHIEHIESESVTHLFKNTPLVTLPNSYKLMFVHSWAGKGLETIMAEEQDYLGEWKIQKIIEAAGQYNKTYIQQQIINDTTTTTTTTTLNNNNYYYNNNSSSLSSSSIITMYSFVDCPWCIAAKTLLEDEYMNNNNNNNNENNTIYVRIIELEELGRTGKAIRAELAKLTGRRSMPCIFINGQPIGGYTDGEPCGIGLRALHMSGQLRLI